MITNHRRLGPLQVVVRRCGRCVDIYSTHRYNIVVVLAKNLDLIEVDVEGFGVVWAWV